MTIYEIKRLSEANSPYYFVPKTMKFFGQTLISFKVYKQPDGRYLITAPMIDRYAGRTMGTSTRYFNPANNKLELS